MCSGSWLTHEQRLRYGTKWPWPDFAAYQLPHCWVFVDLAGRVWPHATRADVLLTYEIYTWALIRKHAAERASP